MPKCKACGKYNLIGSLGDMYTADKVFFCADCWPFERLKELRQIAAHISDADLESILTLPCSTISKRGGEVHMMTYGVLALCRSAVCFIPVAKAKQESSVQVIQAIGRLFDLVAWLRSGGLTARKRAIEKAQQGLSVTSIRDIITQDADSLVFPGKEVISIRWRFLGGGLRLTTYRVRKVVFKCSRRTYTRSKEDIISWLESQTKRINGTESKTRQPTVFSKGTKPENIQFRCPKCAHRLRAAPQLAGKRSKCPHCKNGIEVPIALLQDNSKREKIDVT